MHNKVALALIAATAVTEGVAAWAQTAPPAPPGGGGAPRPERPAGGPDGRMRGPEDHGDWEGRGMMQRMREFALLYPARDKALSGADVQKIAEAFLLVNGNHTWKITEIMEQPDEVTFAVAVADGSAIARFAMDRHTARPRRIS